MYDAGPLENGSPAPNAKGAVPEVGGKGEGKGTNAGSAPGGRSLKLDERVAGEVEVAFRHCMHEVVMEMHQEGGIQSESGISARMGGRVGRDKQATEKQVRSVD